MTTIKTVALIGASGNLGPSILNAFIENGSFDITVISRQESKATFPSSVKVAKVDYSHTSLVNAFKGQDAVVSIAGSGQIGDQKKYIDAAIEAGVKRFIPSEFGNDVNKPGAADMIPLFKPKQDTGKYLHSKESDTFSWTAIVTGPFFDWGMKVGFLGFKLQEHTASFWDDGKTPFSTTNLATIGLATVRVLLPEYVEKTKNKDVHVASFTTSQAEILAAVEKISGQQWKVEKTESAPVLASLTDRVKAGDFGPDVVYPLIMIANFGAGLGNLGDHSAKTWNDVLGLPKEDFEASLKTVLEG